MLSFIIDFLAPKATAELTTAVAISYNAFVDNLEREHRLTVRTDSSAKFKIQGSFFSSMEAIDVTKGKPADPNHYKRIGFNLNVEDLGDGSVRLRAEQRVIFGWIETRAVSNALATRLEQLNSRIAV